MSRYRRDITPGGTFFFTLVSYRRQPILCDVAMRDALRRAIVSTREKHPFTVDAWVLMPDHLHCIWTLPEGDADYAKRWGQIKRRVSRECGSGYKRHEWLCMSKQRHRESTLWQRRYWEHRIRDEKDFAGHMDYIHYNPVKHGLLQGPICGHGRPCTVISGRVFIRRIGRGVQQILMSAILVSRVAELRGHKTRAHPTGLGW